MKNRLVLENKDGQVTRALRWEGDSCLVIRRKDTRRLEVVQDTKRLDAEKVPYETLQKVARKELEKSPVRIGGVVLRLTPEIQATLKSVKSAPEDEREVYRSLAGVAGAALVFLLILAILPKSEPEIEEEDLQQIVKIVKPQQVKPQIQPQPRVEPKPIAKQERIKPKPVVRKSVAKASKTTAVKRMGALAVLGSQSRGSQRGGLNLGAVQATGGPGLGGGAGSGGVQTSLYGKGLVAAPLGSGDNVKGGGGYGTKGKGGGQAGYGRISLIGSAGTDPIPLGREAIVQGGLDRDLIAEVIERHKGEVRYCYEQGLQGAPGLNGRVTLNWVIGGSGHVKVAGVERSSLRSRMVEDCILMRLKTWKFPQPEGRVDVKVSYPFVLRRTGQS